MTALISAVFARLNRARLEAQLLDMLEYYSPPFGEAELVRFVTAQCEQRGLTVSVQPVPVFPGDGRGNILLRLGPGADAPIAESEGPALPLGLLWLGHLDTIALWGPTDEPTRDHRPIRVGNTLRGLGTADMKAGCAAAIEALTALAESGLSLKRGLTVGLVVGEEESGDGAEALRGRFSAPLTVVGEPTELRPCPDHCGYVELRINATGERAHAALPHHGASAVHALVDALAEVLAVTKRDVPFDAHSEAEIAVSVRQLEGGGPQFVVADRSSALLDIHVAPDLSLDQVEASIMEAVTRVGRRHTRVHLAVDRTFFAQGARAEPDDPRATPLRMAFDHVGRVYAPTSFRSHSDANFFHETATIVVGPGRLEHAHRADEEVDLDEDWTAARLYAAAFVEACVR